jgi:Protein of unknown function (DUF2793)
MTTPILDLDEWEEAQAQPNIVVNESTRWLECFAQLSVLSQAVTDPPTAVDGDRYIVATGATGVWAGHDDEIALAMDNAWQFREAPEGAIAYVEDESTPYRYLGGVWTEEAGGGGGGSGLQLYSYMIEFELGDTRQPTFKVPGDAELVAWTLHADVVGDCVIDVWRSDAGVANPPTSNAETIAGAGNEPTLTAERDKEDTDLSDWAVPFLNAGDVIRFVLVSSATLGRVYFQLDMKFATPS